MDKTFPVEVSNATKGSELKELLKEKLNKPMGSIRLFSIGQEILDGNPLAGYGLGNDYVVISKVMR